MLFKLANLLCELRLCGLLEPLPIGQASGSYLLNIKSLLVPDEQMGLLSSADNNYKEHVKFSYFAKFERKWVNTCFNSCNIFNCLCGWLETLATQPSKCLKI